MERIMISQLPEDIIHRILSFLKAKEAAKVSIFCKPWYNAWLTCPTLDFLESFTREKFIKNTLKRYQDQKLCIDQLKLSVLMNDSSSALFVDECIHIAAQIDIKRLELMFDKNSRCRSYTLPRTIFEVKMLRELIIRGSNSRLKKEIGDKIMFSHLQKLVLSEVYIDGDDMFQDIIAGSPLIDSLCVLSCGGMERIKVTNTRNLKKLHIWALWDQSVEIDVPHLQHLCCIMDNGSLDLHTMEKLKYLSLDGKYLSLDSNFMQKFPRVEHLEFLVYNGIERIDIPSRSLKHLVLEIIYTYFPTVRLSELQIDAPSLISFVLNLRTPYIPDLSLANTSSECLSKISMFNADSMNTYQFYKMKQFVTKLVQSKKISLDLSFGPWYKFEHITIDIPICRGIEVEDVNLWFDYRTDLLYTNFPEVLLLTYHPKVVRIQRGQKLPYENLIEERSQCCPLMISTRHDAANSCYKDLKEVRFEIRDETITERHPGDWINILEAPLYPEGVCFRLDWKD